MQKRLETLLNQVSKSPLIDQGDLKAASELILSSVIKGLGVNRSGIWLYNENREGIRCYLLKDLTMEVPTEALVLHRSDFPDYFSALDEDRVVTAHDAITAPETKEFSVGYLDVLGINAMLDTPIRHGGNTVGIICSEHRGEPRTWTDDEVVFAGVLSDLFGRSISAREKLDYELKLEDTNRNLELIVAERTQHLNDTIDELKALQNKLVESEKMAVLGSMVSGVAHEVNTPIGIAVTSSSHIKDGVKKIRQLFESNQITKTSLKNFLDEIEDAADLNVTNLDKAANLITNFKRTSADQHHFEKDRVNLKDYMEKVLSTLVPITKKIGVNVALKGDDIVVETYPGAISQVVTNLITNSCMHGFASTFCGQAEIVIEMFRKDETLHVNYSDNGIGMEDEVVGKIFDPFFTTKRDQGGTGLGMPILHTLISKTLHGDIRVESVVGEGTTFYMSFKNV